MDWFSGSLVITFKGGNTASIHDISFAAAQTWIQRNHADGSTYMYHPYATMMGVD